MSQTTEHAPLAHQDAIGQLHTNHSCSHSRRVGCSRAIGYLHRSIWPDRQTAGGSLCGIALSTICLWCALSTGSVRPRHCVTRERTRPTRKARAQTLACLESSASLPRVRPRSQKRRRPHQRRTWPRWYRWPHSHRDQVCNRSRSTHAGALAPPVSRRKRYARMASAWLVTYEAPSRSCPSVRPDNVGPNRPTSC